jgi:hypothetical protein
MSTHVILIGNPKPTHVGLHLINAVLAADMEMPVMNMGEFFAWPRLAHVLHWRFLGH